MTERCLIIIPTYNERNNLARLAAAIYREGPFHLLVVDDHSPDGTGELADELARQYQGRFFVLHRAGKQGLGTAYIEGFRWGLARQYDLLFEMEDRKSTRLNSSHMSISYAVFCLKKKKKTTITATDNITL